MEWSCRPKPRHAVKDFGRRQKTFASRVWPSAAKISRSAYDRFLHLSTVVYPRRISALGQVETIEAV
jgi:hypothetical protein